MSAEEDRNFLSRWSQRKREALQEAAKLAESKAVAPATETATPAQLEEEDFDLSLLPKLEDLTPSTDLTLFFKKGVPESLRNAALRKMWTLDPAIRDYRSEALDYAYDWNVPGGVPGNSDLPADFDSREIVARIFGDTPTDENVIGNVASQQNQILSHENSLGGALEPQPVPVNQVKVEQHQELKNQLGLAPDDDAPHKKRRHGKALPVSSTKV